MRKDVLSLIDAAYRFDVDEDVWLRGLADAARMLLDAGFGLFTVAYDASDPDHFRLSASIVEGMPPSLAMALPAHAALFDRGWVEATFLGFACDHIRHPRFACHRAGAPELLDRVYGPHGVQDIFSINAVDPTGIGHQINVLQPRRCRLTPAMKTRWSRVAAHVAAARRLRQQLRGDHPTPPEAVLAPDGKVVDAEAPAKSKGAREQLTESVRKRERARGKLRRSDPDLAVAEWKGLVAARWTLVDQFDSDGRRYLVARKNDPEFVGLEALTERERCAVGFAAVGHSNKLIGYEMGIATSTVAVLLSRAARRLGARSRLELMRAFLTQAAPKK